jgi:predicted nucleic acid-binding protein
MLAVDTNIIVRYVTRDHAEQSPRAKRLVDGNDVFVSTTVLLETEWVLRSAYGFSPAEIVEALRLFAGLPSVSLENPRVAHRGLDWFSSGMDFADALHLASGAAREVFVSFDRRLARISGRIEGVTVRAP